MGKDFKLFIEQLQPTNRTLDSFVDFNKVAKNIEPITIKLTQLNYLLGKDNLKEAIGNLYKENPKCFEVLYILIAVRDDIIVINKEIQPIYLQSYFKSTDKILEYIEETGLATIFREKKISNLVDYVFGIEVGLDTNARKNRGGTTMENIIEGIFIKNSISYDKQISNNQFKDLKNLGVDKKRFDYAVKGKTKTYLIEVNFYNAKGSKLNEVARSYTEIAKKINKNSNYEFIWITDGKGWLSAKNKLEEAYNNIPKLYNFSTINEFIELIISEKK